MPTLAVEVVTPPRIGININPPVIAIAMDEHNLLFVEEDATSFVGNPFKMNFLNSKYATIP
jgi:hypothetical protein